MNELLEIYEHNNLKLCDKQQSMLRLLIATYKTKEWEGDPVWITPISQSGWGKSLLGHPFLKMSEERRYRVLVFDSMNAPALISGRQSDLDYGEYLQNKRTFIYVPDMANIIAMRTDEANILYATFRNLFDGFIKKDTGGMKKFYRNIHTNMVGFATDKLKERVEYNDEMGTREIVFDLPTIYEHNSNHPDDRNIANIDDAFMDYIDHLNLDERIMLTQEETDFLDEISRRIAVWRCVPRVDIHGYIKDNIKMEVPTRVCNQLTKLYKALKQINPEKAKDDIRMIERGCGNNLRKKLHQYVYVNGHINVFDNNEVRIVAKELNRSPRDIVTEYMVLREARMV